MYIDDIYTKKVVDVKELVSEFEKQNVGIESMSNWTCPDWSNEYTIFMEGDLGSVDCITSDEEKEKMLKRFYENNFDIPKFFIIKRQYIQDAFGEQEARDETSFYIIYVEGYLEVSIKFLINRIINSIYQSKITIRNRIIKDLKKQLKQLK